MRFFAFYISFFFINALLAVKPVINDSSHGDSLNEIVRYSRNDTLRVSAFISIGNLYQLTMPDRAIYFYQRAIETAYHGLQLKNSAEVEGRFLRSLAMAMEQLSAIYRDRGDVRKEIKLSFDALEVVEFLGDKKSIARSLLNVSESFLSLKDTARYFQCLKGSIQFFKQTADKPGLSRGYFKIGKMLLAQDDSISGLAYLQLALDLQTESKDDGARAGTYNVLGAYYLRHGFPERSFKLNREALRLYQDSHDRHGLLNSLYQLAEVELLRDNLTASNRYATRGLEIANEINFPAEVEKGSFLLSTITERQGDFDAAHFHFFRYVEIRDSLRRNETRKNVERRNIQESYRIQTEDDRYRNDQDILLRQHSRQNQKTLAWFWVSGIVIFLILSFWSWKRYRKHKMQSATITKQMEKIKASILYAVEIQQSLLCGKETMNKSLDDVILIHEPRSLVSGDFYWFRPFETYCVIVCVDCAGEGVDGGFKSAVGTLLLDGIVQHGLTNPVEIVGRFRKEFSEIIPAQNESEASALDISVCIFYPGDKVVEFAGIHNGITIISGTETIHYPSANIVSDGQYEIVGNDIKHKRIELDDGDRVFIFTDGYIDQRGGRTSQQMGYLLFEEILAEMYAANSN